jgi:hypothetical protein
MSQEPGNGTVPLLTSITCSLTMHQQYAARGPYEVRPAFTVVLLL